MNKGKKHSLENKACESVRSYELNNIQVATRYRERSERKSTKFNKEIKESSVTMKKLQTRCNIHCH